MSKASKEIKLPEKEFYHFSLDFACIGGVICRIKNHYILERFTLKELKDEIQRRDK